MTPHAIVATVLDRPGILFGLTKVLAEHEANITYVDIHSGSPTSEIYFEVTLPEGRLESVMGHLGDVSGVESVRETPIGIMPTAEALGARELGLSDRQVRTLLSVDRAEWRREVDDQEQFLNRFGDRLPPELRDEIAALRQRVG